MTTLRDLAVVSAIAVALAASLAWRHPGAVAMEAGVPAAIAPGGS